MELRLNNGAFVHRVYTGTSIPELLAGFQYTQDAEEFAAAQLAKDVARDWLNSSYAVTCSNTGQMRILRHEPKEESSQ